MSDSDLAEVNFVLETLRIEIRRLEYKIENLNDRHNSLTDSLRKTIDTCIEMSAGVKWK